MRPNPKESTLAFYGTARFNLQSPTIKGNYYTESLYSVFLNTIKTDHGGDELVSAISKKICKKQDEKCFITTTASDTLLYKENISFFIENQTKYLPNGTLTIYFEFRTLISRTNSSVNHSFKPLTQRDTDIFVPTEISNSFVTLVINKEQTFKINKLLLCSKSKVFKAMFDCGLQESQTNEVHISDIRHDILKELLFFLQTDQLSKNLKEINIYVIRELFITANKYEIEDLKLICESCLIRNITTENVVEHLKIAYLHNGKSLEKYAKDFMKLYLEDIVNTPDFITLIEQYPKLIYEIKNIDLSPEVYSF